MCLRGGECSARASEEGEPQRTRRFTKVAVAVQNPGTGGSGSLSVRQRISEASGTGRADLGVMDFATEGAGRTGKSPAPGVKEDQQETREAVTDGEFAARPRGVCGVEAERPVAGCLLR
jgi:hypothetical protein